ncbi:probable E3 ubiquitin-protein ligase RHB1A [Punica granatum]|uniref:RING-type E3 ubiquitin transferase n=1 Tax=Punica granatum TaxID=22663 RepID=A0A218WHM9_PUNGR|nr:probable E3 ubiquitin-protein ligase RHB1A [Punica granatum]XP_031371537.1 probable E3 ubiquitin-protein ligase RHB1A [Punica granatum]OWM72063.1 hypothetical protein CDL15_Pgr017946 [Punica granatum]
MGGCCCCSSRSGELNSPPPYYFCPRVSEEHVPLSSHQGSASGLLFDTNPVSSIPDTYRPPPSPLQYEVALEHPQIPAVPQETVDNNNGMAVQTNSDFVKDSKQSDEKAQRNSELEPAEEPGLELSKSLKSKSFMEEEEEVCPTCLEEYDTENPKIITKCEHHFHLACILEWMERSDTCPVCDQEMIFSPSS